MLTRHMVDRVTLTDETVTVWTRGDEQVAATATVTATNVPALIRDHATGERVLPPGRRPARQIRVDIPDQGISGTVGQGWSMTVTCCKFDPMLTGVGGTVATVERPGPGVRRLIVELGANSA